MGAVGGGGAGAAFALDGARHGTGDIDAVVVVVMPQAGEGVGEVLGVDHLVGGVLELHLPAVGRGGGRADEEELSGVGEGQVAVPRVYGGRLAEVDTASVAHDGLAVPDGADVDGGLLVEEGDDYTAKGLEWGPRVYGCRLGDQVADGLQVVWTEDVGGLEVGDEEGVGGRCGLYEGRKIREIETERLLGGDGGCPRGPRGLGGG